MNQIGLIFLFMFGMGWNPFAKAGNFDMQLKVHAVDEVGQPVSDATLLASYGRNRANSLKKGRIESLTDENGFATTPVFNTYGRVSFGMKKEGYYSFGFADHFYKNPGEDFVRPFNPFEKPIEVLMRSKLNPISMYVKKIELSFPVEGKGIGFDLEKSDWVSPHGSGKVSDFIFWFSRNFHDDVPNYDAELKISFSNPRDGIQLYLDQPRHGSKLRLPHHAPKSGYETTIVKQMSFKKDKGYRGFEDPDDSQKNYIFRIRSEENEEGNLVKANYGKIHGSFLLSHTKRRDLKAKITFTYYFNPTVNDHNLEFNPDKNLFGGNKKFAP